ncbi:MAG: ribulose-phosphate 3-epimerase [Clostridia bacterium]|nr:ribulose-phosphate 3-epimerase [Clostridia bacterium]
MKKLSASLMCADLLNLEASVKELQSAGIDYLHIDIMDGDFVPNITMGFDTVNSIRKITDLPLDIHMMVREPNRFIDCMELSEQDILCVHYEADTHIHRTLEQIRKKGVKAGLAINPSTPVDSIKYLTDYIDMLLVMTVSPGFAGQKLFSAAERKTRDAREMLDSMGLNIPIEVDGNISLVNGEKLSVCGAEIFVLGTSSLFVRDKSLAEAARDFRSVI